jgi:hypothetical protein
MDPICRSPYRPAALRKCRTKGLTEDRTQSRAQTLTSRTATTEVLGPVFQFFCIAANDGFDDQPRTLSYQITLFGPIGADV